MTIIHDLGIDAYHAHPADSNTSLKTFRESPLLYFKMYMAKTVARPDSKSFRLGRAVDSLIFDGRDYFTRWYGITPATYVNEEGDTKKWNGNANVCKAWLRTETMLGKTILTSEQHVQAEAMLQAVTHHPLASALLAQCAPQVTFRRNSERFGIEVQARPDGFSAKPIEMPDLGVTSDGLPFFADLKSTCEFNAWMDVLDPESPRNGSPVWKYGYYRQGGLLQWIAHQDVGRTAHFLIVAESLEPFRVMVVQLNDEYLDLGFSEVSADLHRLKACMTANTWPGNVDRVVTLAPPQWLLDAAVRQGMHTAQAGISVMDRAAS